MSRTVGSAPRARGTREHQSRGRGVRRFSPACAGNTSSGSSSSSGEPVQPRVRGEHARNVTIEFQAGGSAPRARGTPLAAVAGAGADRFSPACAGNTPATTCRPRRSSVQPRVRGEHTGYDLPAKAVVGSAQRARGTLRNAGERRHLRRFSPACAGNTSRRWLSVLSRTVQPRVRGEHLTTAQGYSDAYGSAPRARGTRRRGHLEREDRRFSPACAGNTTTSPRRSSPGSVQPRVRGEHYDLPYHVHPSDGSAPRARGTPLTNQRRICQVRFSPACAGNTSSAGGSRSGTPVQPRVRGEHDSDCRIDV